MDQNKLDSVHKEQVLEDLKGFRGEIAKLFGLNDEIARLIEIIEAKHGWTTPVEAFLVTNMISSITAQFNNAHILTATLINASAAIGKEEPQDIPLTYQVEKR